MPEPPPDLRRLIREVIRQAIASPAWSGLTPAEQADRLADRLVEALRLGPLLSATAVSGWRRRRDARIRAAFDGRNHHALARAAGLSVRQVRRIVRASRK